MIERAEHPRQPPGANSRCAFALALALLAASCAPALRPPVETGKRAPDLVEIVTLEPGLHLDIRYATARNFVGRPVYAEARAFLQRPAAEALVRAHRALAAEGYGIVVFDGYRPWSVTSCSGTSRPRTRRSSWPIRARARATTAAAPWTSPSTTSPPGARSRCRAATTR